MDAHIRYLAILTDRPGELAAFYRQHLGMSELGHNTEGDVSLTDGFYNLALLKRRAALDEPDDRPGLSHLGVAISDIRDIEARLEEFAPNADIQAEPGDLHHGQYRVSDPNGLAVSLSVSGFGVDSSSGRPNMPRIRHVAYSVPKNDDVLDFYVKVFGFREVGTSHYQRQIGAPARFAGDGETSLAILRDPDRIRRDHRETDERNIRYGVNHFGFLVPDVQALLARLPESSAGVQRPSIRPMAEYRAYDPDVNGFDISQDKGFEVDLDRWARYPEETTAG